ncbi:hypothetical protein ABHV44_09925 [Flavobacteriales bacterium DA487]
MENKLFLNKITQLVGASEIDGKRDFPVFRKGAVQKRNTEKK